MRLTLTHSLPVPVSEAFGCLADLSRFAAAHPVIVAAPQIRGDRGNYAGGYQVQEKLKLWGILPLSPSYHVDVWAFPHNHTVRYWTRINRYVGLRIDFTFRPLPAGTLVEEAITTYGNSLAGRILLSQMRPLHQKLMANLARQLQMPIPLGSNS